MPTEPLAFLALHSLTAGGCIDNVQFAQILRRILRKNQNRFLRSVQPNAELAEVCS